MEEIFSSAQDTHVFDYLKILKALNEIHFLVGKNLLIDFLTGDSTNASVSKNNLTRLKNFNSLKLSKDEVREQIDDLVKHKFIDISGTLSNPFLKLLSITSKGNAELTNPQYYIKKQKEAPVLTKFEISTEEIYEFQEFEKFLEKFNENQRKAIISKNEKIMCIAGAGSGKTDVLTKRIEFLVKHRNVDPSKILAITFTRKARQEMRFRLSNLGISTNVETFNSLGEAILNKNEKRIYGRPIRIMNTTDKITAIKEALADQNKSLAEAVEEYFSPQQKANKTPERLMWTFINDCFSIIDYFKSKDLPMHNFSLDADAKHYSSALMIYKTCKFIKEYMEKEGLRDYTDQIVDSLNFFKYDGREEIPSFEHILVDEYQDLNSMQVSFIKLLNPPNLFGVGDPRQSIFGWRGSEITHITNFEKEYSQGEVIPLVVNYRSTKRIVELMNASIKHLGFPDLVADKLSENEQITLEKFETEMDEILDVIQKIIESKSPREEIFVLARTNRQLIEIAKIMRSIQIPYILKTEDENSAINAKEGEITLATIHSIKGLQARETYVIGCNVQNFPCKASDHPVIELIKMENYDKEEEEKRLFYVAISRAKEKLYLSYTGTKTDYINEDMIKIIND
ncbi:MAG: UvrD-helicase domain-containing protein [archaeon]